METQNSEIRIYVACLAAYNNGWLHGWWIDATQELEAIQLEVADMLEASPISDSEEWAIHDYEGFEGAPISEYQGIESVANMAAFIAEYGALGGKLIEHYGGDMDDARTAIEERYFGEYARLADFAEESIENAHDIPDALRPYIDYEAMGRDWEMSDLLVIETGFEQVHIFGSH
ncbi:antirestriction protein [Maricaulis sp. W15]|uniref:antirestriction protein ArdA n=1 Tax=Maricaulis sp. W15 TaxID=1772333 RepID=UPI000948BA81|nr:antirestriction protein ArdA [Maricaulis sp. W15]OLF71420.1 antirestriction protein [Maricaulis sp. W15]